MVSSCSGAPCCVIVGWFNGNQLMVDLVAHNKCSWCRCLILILVKKAEKRKVNDEPTDPETPRNKDLKYDREKRTRTFQNSY
jgi:hypothetical protein